MMKQIIIVIISIILIATPLPEAAEAPSPTRVDNIKLTTKKKATVVKTEAKIEITPAVQPAPVIVTPAPPQLGTCDEWIIKAGITDVVNAKELIRRESGCNPFATNASSGAYGIPQSLPASKMASAGDDWQTNPVTQLKWMSQYVASRYGSFAGAVAFHNVHGWY